MTDQLVPNVVKPRVPGSIVSPDKTPGGSRSRRVSTSRVVLQQRDHNVGSDTQSIGSLNSAKSFMSNMSFKSRVSVASRPSVRSSGSILSHKSFLSAKSALSAKPVKSHQSAISAKSITGIKSAISVKSTTSRMSSISFETLRTYNSDGLCQEGRSHSESGGSSQAVLDWDDGWQSSKHPKEETPAAYVASYVESGLSASEKRFCHFQPPFRRTTPRSYKDQLRMEATVRAARNGNDQLISFLLSSGLADPDPYPCDILEWVATPMLAAIGQRNIKVIEVLLKQEGFNSTRRLAGKTYFEIARARQGPVWEDEERILKQAYDQQAARLQNDDLGKETDKSRAQLDDCANRAPESLVSGRTIGPPSTALTTDSSTPNESSTLNRDTSESISLCPTLSVSDSEASSFSMIEGSDNDHSEDESPCMRRAERRQFLLRNLMDVVYFTYRGSGAMNDGESSSSGTNTRASNTSSSPHNQGNKPPDPKGKRRLPDDDNGDGEGNGDRQQPKRSKPDTVEDVSDAARKFACPYYQRNRHRRQPNINLPRRACYGPGFVSVHRLKEHLYRAHIIICCPRCDDSFDSDDSLRKHMIQDPPCRVKAKQQREGIDSTKEKLLRGRKKEFKSKTEEDKWRYVYMILFPADNPQDLPTPYHEHHMEASFAEGPQSPKATVKQYDEFMQRELFPRIYRVLENNLDEAVDSAEKEASRRLKSQLQMIFRNVQTELFEEFFQPSTKSKGKAAAGGHRENVFGISSSEDSLQNRSWPSPLFGKTRSLFDPADQNTGSSSPFALLGEPWHPADHPIHEYKSSLFGNIVSGSSSANQQTSFSSATSLFGMPKSPLNSPVDKSQSLFGNTLSVSNSADQRAGSSSTTSLFGGLGPQVDIADSGSKSKSGLFGQPLPQEDSMADVDSKSDKSDFSLFGGHRTQVDIANSGPFGQRLPPEDSMADLGSNSGYSLFDEPRQRVGIADSGSKSKPGLFSPSPPPEASMADFGSKSDFSLFEAANESVH
ncbi:hypothetical protein F5B20DRAFT_424500 [Whalleya microplaca]|nr:hypothetical protein F5B20DRAFT_424500 [Whalleya microplaca]